MIENKTKLKEALNFNKETIIHILFWLLYVAMVNVSWTRDWFNRSLRPVTPSPMAIISFPVLFYLNAFYLIPKYLSKSKWITYIIITTVLIIIYELFIILLAYLFSDYSGLKIDFLVSEWHSRDNIILGNPSPAGLALFFSFVYRFSKDWFLNNQRIERLETDKLRKELLLLKAQINPHFLFNNLNTLDQLIDQSPHEAKKYLHKMSRIYRYILMSTDKELVPLSEEMVFAQDYSYLIHERFQGAYQFEFGNILPQTSWFIPPASLQILMENVIKHNEGKVEHPLITTISIKGPTIEISHPKRQKMYEVESLGTGLQNLNDRYRLICNKKIEIKNTDSFSVSLPLITAVT